MGIARKVYRLISLTRKSSAIQAFLHLSPWSLPRVESNDAAVALRLLLVVDGSDVELLSVRVDACDGRSCRLPVGGQNNGLGLDGLPGLCTAIVECVSIDSRVGNCVVVGIARHGVGHPIISPRDHARCWIPLGVDAYKGEFMILSLRLSVHCTALRGRAGAVF
jgi:hypothetical protein